MSAKTIKKKLAFTLMELLIIVGVLTTIAIVVLVVLNPWGQIKKGHDSKRKQELIQLSKVMEDYYNDKKCYPKPDELCYNNAGATTCNICGNETTPLNFSNFSPYSSLLPCDPRHPNEQYLYQVDNVSCPLWYRIYTTLSIQSDPVIAEVGCGGGCGISPNYVYNYGVSSPNIGLESNNNLCSLANALYINPFCNICGNYSQCKINNPGETYYIDPSSCVIPCIKD